MISENNYSKWWGSYFDNSGYCPVPDYSMYLKREILFSYYLKLFGIEYVLNERAESELKNIVNPYSKGVEPSEVKYILIGEAPPPSYPPRKYSTYFFDTQAIGRTNYFIQPYNAFVEKEKRTSNPFEDKVKALEALAVNGVLLIDVFPYAISYSEKLRLELINNNGLEFFWKELIKRLVDLKIDYKGRFAFLTSIDHAEYIIESLADEDNVGNLKELSKDTFQNWLKHKHNKEGIELKGNSTWHTISDDLVLSFASLEYSSSGRGKKIHKYRQIAKTNIGLFDPHAIPIRFAFNI